MKSAVQNPLVIDEYLTKECVAGRVIGPLNPADFPQVQISRFGVIPKKHAANEWRMILDLSYPPGSSVNDGVDRTLSSLSYPSVGDAIKEIAHCGQGCLLAKADVKSAFRIVPVHPDDRLLLGMKWREQLFIDTTLPFGLRSAPKIFNCLADGLTWISKMRGVRFVIHYLDDFLFIGPPASSECAYALATFINLCETLGIPLSPQKVIGPVTCLDFLGIELDSVAMEARLPASKLQHLQSTVNTWLGRKSCQKRELLSLIGELQHASSVVRSGRTFLQRMICLSTAAKELYHHIRLNKEFRSDLTWWATFLQSWNGTNMMRAINRESPEITLTSDASGSWECGAFWHDQWFHFNWHPAWESMDITVKELLPIVVGAAVWGSHWAHRTVLCLCDNAAVVAIINTGRSKNEPAMHLLRCLLFIAAHHEFDIFARHLPGACNSAADALSRDRLPLFFSTVPQASPHPTPIPHQLMQVLVLTQPDWISTDWANLFSSCSRRALLNPPRDPITQARRDF